jgi:SEC-C motif-containing protein
MNLASPCLCGSNLEYQQCCEPFHSGKVYPSTALSLMRSRYTAYVLRNVHYLQETWDITKRPAAIDFSRENITWLRLEIVDFKKGGVNDNKGIVTFKAFYQQDDIECVMNEISRFTKTNDRWYYLDGVIKSMGAINSQTNQGKNAACSCGSGKKFKRCCGTH